MKQLNIEPIKVELYGDKFKANVFANVTDGKLTLVAHEHVTKKSSDDDTLPYELSMEVAGVTLAENEFIIHEDMEDEFVYPIIQEITARKTRVVKDRMGRTYTIIAIKPELI